MKPTPAKILIAFALVLSGVLGLTITTHAWDTSEVHGECDEWDEDSLTPLGRVDVGHQIHGFKWSEVFEDFEWGVDGDSISDSGGDYTWSELVGGASFGEISVDTSTDGFRGCHQYYDGDTSWARIDLVGTDDMEIGFWNRKDTACYLGFYWGDGADVICWNYRNDGKVYYIDGVTSTYLVTVGCLNEWNYWYINEIDWTANTYDLWFNGERIGNNLAMRTSGSYGDTLSLSCFGYQGSMYTDEFNVWYDESESGSFGEGGYRMTVTGLEGETWYYLYAWATTIVGTYSISDVFACKTTGTAPFPIWLVILLFAVVLLGIYTKSLVLSIAGIILCVVSYSWLLQSSADDVGLWGGAAFFLILIAWIILNLVYRARNG